MKTKCRICAILLACIVIISSCGGADADGDLHDYRLGTEYEHSISRAMSLFSTQLCRELRTMERRIEYRTNGEAALQYFVYDKEKMMFEYLVAPEYFFMIRLVQSWPDSDRTEPWHRVTLQWFAIDGCIEHVYWVHFSRNELWTLEKWRASEYYLTEVAEGECGEPR